jgi:WS/DGAT/MGAT family acyltransferase
MPDGMRLMLKPVESLARTGRLLRGVAATGALGRLALRPPDPVTRFKGALMPEKRAAWSTAVPLDELRGVAHALGATINDILLTAVTGGLRRYLVDHDDPVETRLAFRAAVPVNLRPLGSMDRLGNRFGLVFLSMPVGIADPLDRLAEVRRRMRSLRASAEPLVTFGILKLMGRGPLALQRAVVNLLAAKTTAVMTNVPGPRTPLSLAGRTIRDLFFWVPQAGRVGIGISIMSYAGEVRVGIGTDAGLVPDPESIVAAYEEELTTLLRCGHGFDASWMWGAEKGRKAVSWVLPQ